jgi:hypothetical protein
MLEFLLLGHETFDSPDVFRSLGQLPEMMESTLRLHTVTPLTTLDFAYVKTLMLTSLEIGRVLRAWPFSPKDDDAFYLFLQKQK